MKRVILFAALMLALAGGAQAQVVSQGAGGTSPWRVTFGGTAQPVTVSSGTVTFSNATIGISGDVSLHAETTKVIGTVNIAVGQSIAVTGTFWQATQPVSGTFYQATQPVSIASMPSTPVTNTNLDIALSALRDALVGSGPKTLTDVTTALASLLTELQQKTEPADQQHTIIDSASLGTVTVTGALTDTQLRASAVPISAAALPLPTLAATSTKQSDGSQKTQVVDGAGNVIGATSNALDVNIKSGNPTTIAVTSATATSLKAQAEAYQGGSAVSSSNPLQVTLANTGANATAVKVDGSAVTQPVSNAGLTNINITSSALRDAIAGTNTLTDVVTAENGTANTIAALMANTSLAGIYVQQDNNLSMARESGGNLATIATRTAPFVAAAAGGYVRQDSTGTIAKETGGNLATVKTNTDPLVTSGGGGYVRQDSTATIAKETGGNLATAATNTGTTSTNTAPLLVSGAGAYMRQDSTGTMAKESGGNLATIASATHAEDTPAVDGDVGIKVLARRNDNGTLTTTADGDNAAIAVDQHGHVQARMLAQNPDGTETILRANPAGTLAVTFIGSRALPLFPCNAVRRMNCQPIGITIPK